MKTFHDFTTFHRGALDLSETVLIDEVPHITRRAIGELLEYANPQQSIYTLIERNLFVESYSVVISMISADGKNYDTRVYNPIGFLLIAMSSDQPKAIELKIAIAEFVSSYSAFDKMEFKQLDQLRKFYRRTVIELSKTTDTTVRHALINVLHPVCQQLGIPQLFNAQIGHQIHQTDIEAVL